MRGRPGNSSRVVVIVVVAVAVRESTKERVWAGTPKCQ